MFVGTQASVVVSLAVSSMLVGESVIDVVADSVIIAVVESVVDATEVDVEASESLHGGTHNLKNGLPNPATHLSPSGHSLLSPQGEKSSPSGKSLSGLAGEQNVSPEVSLAQWQLLVRSEKNELQFGVQTGSDSHLNSIPRLSWVSWGVHISSALQQGLSGKVISGVVKLGMQAMFVGTQASVVVAVSVAVTLVVSPGFAVDSVVDTVSDDEVATSVVLVIGSEEVVVAPLLVVASAVVVVTSAVVVVSTVVVVSSAVVVVSSAVVVVSSAVVVVTSTVDVVTASEDEVVVSSIELVVAASPEVVVTATSEEVVVAIEVVVVTVPHPSKTPISLSSESIGVPADLAVQNEHCRAASSNMNCRAESLAA
jgi:hypothetical protein